MESKVKSGHGNSLNLLCRCYHTLGCFNDKRQGGGSFSKNTFIYNWHAFLLG